MDQSTHATQLIGERHTHALLVGVDRYLDFDRSGASNLRGSRNDVVILAWYCMEVLGVPPENIRALTSPLPTADELRRDGALSWLSTLPAENRGEATVDGVREGLAWLFERTKGEGSAAVLAFSGHGAWSGEAGPVLCLADTSQELTRGVLPLREIRARVAEAGARSRLVVVLDCCHVTGPASDARLTVTALPSAGVPEPIAKEDFDVSDRVLLAAKPGKPAYQMRLGRDAHGALTFALVTAAERWRADQGASEGSYKQVWKRIKGLVKALGVPQRPQMMLPAARWKEIRKEPFLGVSAGVTVKNPDARQRHVQLDPSTKSTGYRVYTWSNAAGAQVAQTIVPATAQSYSPGNAYAVGDEYWFVLGTAVSAPTVMSWTDVATWPPSDPMNPAKTGAFTNARAPAWSSKPGQRPVNLCQFMDVLGLALPLYLGWELAYSSPTKSWSGSLTWVTTAAQTETSRYFAATAEGQCSLVTAPPTLPSPSWNYFGGFP
jgi:Caspase domain